MTESTWTKEELATAWIERYLPRNSNSILLRSNALNSRADPAPKTFWAFETLNSLVTHSPEDAWQIILMILKLARDKQDVLDNLAAGPLESLISRHGRTVVEWIEAEARRSSDFKELLRGVWNSNIPKLIWDRIERAGK